MRPRVCLALAFTAAQLTLVVLMIAATAFKIARFGWLEFFQHYTNWSWALQTFFYAATLPAPLLVALGITDWRLTLMTRFIAVTFLPLWGIVNSILYLVIIMLLSGSEMLAAISLVVPISIIVVGNEVFHFFTVLVLLSWTIAMQNLVYFSLNQLFAERAVHRKRKLFWALVAYEAVFGPAITMLAYLSIFDAQVVYQTTLSVLIGALAVTVLWLIAVGVPLVFFVYFFWMGYEPLDARWLPESKFEAAYDRIATTYANASKSNSKQRAQ